MEVLKACCPDPAVLDLWKAVICSDLDLHYKDVNVVAVSCRQSGEKSTSWGNTFLTYLFV